MNVPLHDSPVPVEPVQSEWVIRFGSGISTERTILDVACGSGRHANWFAARGHPVHAVDRDAQPNLSPSVVFTRADIEGGLWPYVGQSFAAVIVTNYLHRPLMQALIDSVEPAGWLIYETFAAGNEKYGRPSRADFLLRPGELLEIVRGQLCVAAYEHRYVDSPKPAVVQRIAARRMRT